MEDEEKTAAQLKEEAIAKKWRETLIEGQQGFFDDTPKEVVYAPEVHVIGSGWERYYNSEDFLASFNRHVEAA